MESLYSHSAISLEASIVAGLCFAGAIAVLRLALLDRGSRWSWPTLAASVAVLVLASVIDAAVATALAAFAVLGVIQALAFRIAAPRSLLDFARQARRRDGTPAWWPAFESELRNYTQRQGTGDSDSASPSEDQRALRRKEQG